MFKLSAAQLAEAEAAFRTCANASFSLTEAMRFAVLHAKPPAGAIPVGRVIEEAFAGTQKQAAYVFGGSR